MNKLLSVFISLISLAALLPLQASEQISFVHIGLDKGLSQSTVFDIAQDSKGNMWFATYGGVNKYNGYDFTVYQHDEGNANSIASDIVRTVKADVNGGVWIGTSEGLSHYSMEKDAFKNFSYKKDGKNIQVNNIIDIDPGHLLLNTSCGLLLFDVKQSGFTTDKLNAALFQLKATAVHRHGDYLYIGTEDGLFVYSISGNSLKAIASGALKQKYILVLLQQSDSRLWVGTEGHGLYLVNPKTDEIKNYTSQGGVAGRISSDFVRALALDSQNRLWVGTFTSLNVYNEENDTFTSYNSNLLRKGALSQGSVRSICADSQGGMWLGTYFGGLNYYHPLKERFGHIRYVPYQKNSLNDNVIGCMVEDKDKNLWIGTNNGGLNLYNSDTKTFSNYTMEQGMGSNDIKAVYVDEVENRVYVGSHTGGLSILNRATGRIENFIPRNSALADENVYAIQPDGKGGLWLGTMKALVHFNPQKKTFETLSKERDGKPFGSTRIRTILQDSKHRLWVGGEEGLAVYSQDKEGGLNSFQLFTDVRLTGAFVHCIHEANSGIYWIGTRNGLYGFDEVKKELKHYGVTNGLPNHVVYGILEDALGRLWISTDKGLSCFHPETEKCRNFTAIDGLQSNQFTPYAYCRTANGMMYFGGINGITTFRPERLTDNPYAPSVVISGLGLFNVPVRPDDETGILTKHISETGHITLKHSQSAFGLEFVVSNYLAGTHNMFAYQLEGYDKDWYYVDEHHRWVTYSNLPHGNYRFLVKAANNDGVWNDTPTVLEITILPAWYQMWWAVLLFIAAFGGIAALIFRYQMERTDKVRQKEMHEMKVRFFINISHELRTPLTLILSPLQEVLDRVSDRWTRTQLEHIKRNANRLLYLVNQLMDYRRAEQGVFSLRVKPHSVHEIIERDFLYYDRLAQRKKINYNFYSEMGGKTALCDANYLELIVNNLLSNAFKYTHEGQDITVILKMEGKDLLLEVKDTGDGIPAEKQQKVFERFYQMDGDHMGSGIGLSLVQRLVELHHGRIELDSEKGRGSTFSIYLPRDASAYRKEEVISGNEESEDVLYTTNTKDLYFVDTEEVEEVVPETGNKKRETILIVEDNVEIQRFLSEALSKSFNVLEVGNGEEALELLKEHEVDMVLTDVMMPVMDGVKLCKSIKQNLRTCHIPVIMLSAKMDMKDQMEGLQVGADDYIAKPFSMALLVTKIRNILRTHYRSIEHYSNSLEIEPEKIALNPLDEEFLKKAVGVMETHMDDIEFSTDEFAGLMNMSRSNLHLKMKAITGEPTIEFIRKMRFNRACQLLKEGRYNVAEISVMVGFNTPSYFATCFKKYMGCLPSEYAKSGGVQQN